jgi:hypothetical protein
MHRSTATGQSKSCGPHLTAVTLIGAASVRPVRNGNRNSNAKSAAYRPSVLSCPFYGVPRSGTSTAATSGLRQNSLLDSLMWQPETSSHPLEDDPRPKLDLCNRAPTPLASSTRRSRRRVQRDDAGEAVASVHRQPRMPPVTVAPVSAVAPGSCAGTPSAASLVIVLPTSMWWTKMPPASSQR